MTVLLSALLLASMQTDGPIPIRPYWDGAVCSTLIDGVAIPADRLGTEIKHWARHGRPVAVISAEIPYRCVGSTIFALQRGGYRISEGIGSPPAFSVSMVTTVRFAVMPGTCAFRVNDEPVTEGELTILMASWKRYNAPVHLVPDMNTEYRCVDSAMKHIISAGINNLGFTGNDLPAAEGPK